MNARSLPSPPGEQDPVAWMGTVALVAPLLAVYLAPSHALGAWLTWISALVLLVVLWLRSEYLPLALRSQWPVLLLCAWAVLSFAWSAPESVRAGDLETPLLVILFALAWSVLAACSALPGRTVGIALPLAAGASALAAIAFAWTEDVRLEGLGRLDNAVVAGGVWTCGFALGLGTLLDLRRSGAAPAWLIAGLVAALGVTALAVLLTQSRGPLLALLAAALVVVTLYGGRRLVLAVGLLALLALGIVALVLPEAFGRLGLMGLGRRLEGWQMALELFRAAPLLGRGLGTPESLVLSGGHFLEHAHSVPLGIAVALGTVGLVIYLVVLAVAVLRIWSAAEPALGVVAALAAGVLAGAVDGRLPFTRVDEAWLLLWVPVFLALSLRGQAAGR